MNTSTIKECDNQRRHSGGHKTRVRDAFDGLTPLQFLFCYEFLTDLNGTAAYIRAGGSKNYNTARQLSCILLRRGEIRKKIREIVEVRFADKNILQSSVLHSLVALATTSITDVVSWDGNGKLTIKSPVELTQEQASAIQRVRQHTRRTYTKDGQPVDHITLEVMLYDKCKPLALLGKHLQLFDRQENSESSDLGKRLEAAKARAAESRRLRLVAGEFAQGQAVLTE